MFLSAPCDEHFILIYYIFDAFIEAKYVNEGMKLK